MEQNRPHNSMSYQPSSTSDQSSIHLSKYLSVLNAQREVKGIKYSKMFEETRYQYPDEHNNHDELMLKPAYQYVKVMDTERKYKGKKVECEICYEVKDVKTGRWCRQCSKYICAGCYQSCKTAGPTERAISVVDYTGKSYTHYDQKAKQPRCPHCRGDGTFGTQGIKATRVKCITQGNSTKIFGPDVCDDVILQKKVKDYIKEYNRTKEALNEKIAEQKVGIATSIKFIEESDEYNGLCDDINAQRAIIADYEKKIQHHQYEIYELSQKQKQFVADNSYNSADNIVNGITVKHAYKDNECYILCRYLTAEYPRLFFGSWDGHLIENDVDIARKSFCSKYNHGLRKHGGMFKGLDDKLIEVRNYYDYLLTGAINPSIPIKVDDMADDELAIAIARLQQEQASRKGKTSASASK